MKKLQASDWATLVFSIPFGGLCGAIVGSLAALLIVGILNRSIEDVLFGGLLGGLAGLIAGPLLVARQWRERDPF